MRRLIGIGLSLCLNLASVGVDDTYQPRGIGRVEQFRVNPFNSDQGWAMTPSSVLFNRGIRNGDRWQVVFTRRTFRRLTKKAPSRNWTLKRIYPSKRRRGHLFITLENKRGTPELFHSTDYGDSWRSLGPQKNLTKRRKKKDPRSLPKTSTITTANPDEESVDLGALDEEESSGRTRGAATGGGAVFKAYFDLILQYRPGISNLTFDNWHPILLVDYAPRPGMTFSAEVNPAPRYYQLDWELTERLRLFVGRIQIPFDDMGPHNHFGGYLNNSQTQLPNAPAFLPDIWADLGLGIRYDLIDSPSLAAHFYVYVVNGFGEGGTDPLGEVSFYPNFGNNVGVEDNNSNKTFGGRFAVTFFKSLELGFSGYVGRWSNEANEPLGLTLFGLDMRLRLRPWLLRAGYSFFAVSLPSAASVPTFKRAGAYAELKRNLGENWYGSFLSGILQTDDRATDAGDQFNVGGRIGYNLRLADISLAYRYDLRATALKAGQHHAQARLVLIL